MSLGKEVGLGPGHIVLDGDPVGTQRPHSSPSSLRPMSIVAKRSPISAWMLSPHSLLSKHCRRNLTSITHHHRRISTAPMRQWR